mmetsp:Transcript_1207/g.3118  ORF Transcript_1207/g.3118 Transcript_1207/m.3118 type:complete len:126 (+) Transcript_1207:3-380(+)
MGAFAARMKDVEAQDKSKREKPLRDAAEVGRAAKFQLDERQKVQARKDLGFEDDDLAWYERDNNLLALGLAVLAVLGLFGSSFLRGNTERQYEEAVKSNNYALVRCLDTAFGGTEKTLCMQKYKQ